MPQVVTAEGTGQSRTATAVDYAGNSASATVGGINIDKTEPELAARCAPPGGSPFLAGRDGLSGIGSVALTGTTPVQRGKFKSRQSYTILDNAGNRLEAVFGVKAEGHEAEFTLLSLTYNGGPARALPENELKCEWALERSGALKELEQELEVGHGRHEAEAKAKFRGERNETEIRLGDHQRVTRPGAVFLNLTTNQGRLGLDF
jgi:hypothetical protein